MQPDVTVTVTTGQRAWFSPGLLGKGWGAGELSYLSLEGTSGIPAVGTRNDEYSCHRRVSGGEVGEDRVHSALHGPHRPHGGRGLLLRDPREQAVGGVQRASPLFGACVEAAGNARAVSRL